MGLEVHLEGDFAFRSLVFESHLKKRLRSKS